MDALRLAEALLAAGSRCESGTHGATTKFTYAKEPAKTDSEVFLDDAHEVVDTGREFLRRLDEYGTEPTDETSRVFSGFVEAIYGAGMVMSDFNGPLFDSGPGRLIFDREVAAAIVRRANLLTVRMFLHTLARGHRATEFGNYSYFDEAYESGGLKCLLDRLDEFCRVAKAAVSKTIGGG